MTTDRCRFALLFGLALLVAGCPSAASDDDDDDDDAVATYAVTLTGVGYIAHDGMLYEAVVYDGAASSVLSYATGTHAADEMLITLQGVPDGTWDVFWYFDRDENGACTPPPDDHGWDTPVTVEGADVTVSFDHDLEWTDNCENIHAVGATAR